MDTHAIHFHLFNVQVINRVGWDGAIKPPDPNELGWKETVRMNPLEDVHRGPAAGRADAAVQVPDSVRPLDPTHAARRHDDGSPTSIRPTATRSPSPTQLANFGWEYVWHCHLLGHEENDMMRPMVFQVSPGRDRPRPHRRRRTPVRRSTLSWTNNWTMPAATNVLVQRATDAAFTTPTWSQRVPVSPTRRRTWTRR